MSVSVSERILVAMSGGVDSSVAAALLLEAGHDVTGVTLKLWGGDSDSGCCSVADVEDPRHVAPSWVYPRCVFNFTEELTRRHGRGAVRRTSMLRSLQTRV